MVVWQGEIITDRNNELEVLEAIQDAIIELIGGAQGGPLANQVQQELLQELFSINDNRSVTDTENLVEVYGLYVRVSIQIEGLDLIVNVQTQHLEEIVIYDDYEARDDHEPEGTGAQDEPPPGGGGEEPPEPEDWGEDLPDDSSPSSSGYSRYYWETDEDTNTYHPTERMEEEEEQEQQEGDEGTTEGEDEGSGDGEGDGEDGAEDIFGGCIPTRAWMNGGLSADLAVDLALAQLAHNIAMCVFEAVDQRYGWR